MLEYMMLRPVERVFTDAATAHLEFFVLDELHTYRGRQGADVAMLMRRLRERCGNPKLLNIGTIIGDKHCLGEHAVHQSPLPHAAVFEADSGRTQRVFQGRRMNILTVDDDDAEGEGVRFH
jgi:ATP-dependent helicase YprA (DUF1998 family)